MLLRCPIFDVGNVAFIYEQVKAYYIFTHVIQRWQANPITTVDLSFTVCPNYDTKFTHTHDYWNSETEHVTRQKLTVFTTITGTVTFTSQNSSLHEHDTTSSLIPRKTTLYS